mgnify:CR=1 FL=1
MNEQKQIVMITENTWIDRFVIVMAANPQEAAEKLAVRQGKSVEDIKATYMPIVLEKLEVIN